MDLSSPDGSQLLEVQLERVLGLTVSNGAALDCHPASGLLAYTAGCVAVLANLRKNRQTNLVVDTRRTLTCLAFSSDGHYLATGECGHSSFLRIWGVQDQAQLVEFSGHKFGINCVAFSPNGKYVVSVGSQHDMTVNVWEWQSKLKIASSKVSTKVKAMSFSASGSYFVTVGNHHVKFWYLEYSRTAKYKPTEGMPLLGRSAILGDQRSNYFCDVGCGRGDMADSTFAVTKSGLLCEFNSRRLLDKWVELKTTSAHSLCVGEFALAVGCADGIVRCFSPFDLHFLCTLPKPHPLGVDVAKGLTGGSKPSGSGKHPDTVAVTLDELNKKVICIYSDHSLYTWDLRDTKKIGKSQSFLYHSACIWGVEVYPDDGGLLPTGTFLTCSSDDTIRIWNLEPNHEHKNVFSSELIKILYTDPDLAYLCDVHPSEDKLDTVFDGKNGVRCLKISPDGLHLASGDRSGNIRIYDLRYMEMLFKIEAHDAEVLSLEYSKYSGGRSKKYLCSASRDRLIHIFDANQEYGFLQTLDDHTSSVTAAKFLQSNGQLHLVSCGADKAVIFRKAQFIPQLKLVREQQVVGKATLYDMEVEPGQKHVLTACQDQNIRVFCATSARQRRCFKGALGDEGTLIKVVLDPTGTYVATSSTDKNVYIFEYETGRCVAAMAGHSELVTGLKFTPSGKHIISVSGDGCIFVWKLPTAMTQNMAKQSLLSSPTKTWQTTRKNAIAVAEPIQKQNKADSPDSGYEFNVGQLPAWAKKQMAADTPTRDHSGSHPPIPPRGRWAQRIDGQGLVVKSYLNSDSIIPFPGPQPGQEEIKEKPIPSSRVSTASPSGVARIRHPTDSSSTNSSLRMEDVEAEDERSDNSDKGRAPHGLYHSSTITNMEDLSSSSFNVCGKSEGRAQKKIRKSRSDILKTPDDLTSDGEDSGGGSSMATEPSGGLSFSMSTENLAWLDQREKFLKRNYESLEAQQAGARGDSRHSISTKYLAPSTPTSLSTPDKYLPAHTTGPPQIPEKPTFSPSLKKIQAQTKKREELTKALNDAKKKLETLGWRRGLGASKSVGDLRNLPDKESIWNGGTSEIGDGGGGDIRRTSSYTDLTGQRRLLPVTPQPPLKNKGSENNDAPLWDHRDRDKKLNEENRSKTLPRSLSAMSLRRLSLSQTFSDSSSEGSPSPTAETTPSRRNGAKLSVYTPQPAPKGISQSRSEWDLKGALRREIQATANVPLTKETCEKIAEELNRVTTHAMNVFQRVTMDPTLSVEEKGVLTSVLAGGVWRAQQNLRPAVPPLPPDGGAAMYLLQQYSDKLLTLVEQRFNKTSSS